MTRQHIARLLAFGLSIGVLTMGMARAAEADITVTNISDADEGSLRWAIQEAAPGDTITFDLGGCPCTIALTSELLIYKNLTIIGPGPSQLAVSGQGTSRVFRIALAATVVHLEGLTVRDGNGVGGVAPHHAGGGISNDGTLTLLNMVVTDNRAATLSGGGIFSPGALIVRNSRFTYNEALHGGAIAARGSLLMIGSAITGNAATDGGGGGLTASSGANVTIVGSTFADNSATGRGGGVDLESGHLTLVNSTLSGNTAAFGGAVYTFAADSAVSLVNITVIGNTSTEGLGGGFFVSSPSTGLALNNSIVTGNTPADIEGPNTVTANSSLVGGVATTILNTTLADNGGPTPTHALAPNSPAIDGGDNALLPADTVDLDNDGDTTEPVPVDQRGLGFPRIAGFNVDIGAVEAVCSAIVLTRNAPPALPSVGVAYSETIVASGGAGPYSFTATGLPGGLTLSPTTGVLSGTPTASGTFTVTVTVTDAYGCVGTLTYTLTIADTSCSIVIGPSTLKTPYLATLYYQPLSVTPSGQYTVTVSAGALPQGVYLFAIGKNWYLGGIPSAPGTYTFTLAATKTNSPCAPTRTYTVTVPATVLPQLTCVAKTGAKQYTAHFGYDNSTDAAVAIPVGAANYFTPGAQDRGQVTTFQKGRVTNAFSVVFTVKNNTTDLALWYLRGPDNVRRPVNITTATSRCP